MEGKVALITGSSYGIGREIARELAKRGARVVLNARHAQRLKQTADSFRESGLDVHVIAADVTKPGEARRLVAETLEHFGRLDILVSNVGTNLFGEFAETEPEAMRRIVEVNYLAALYVSREAIKELMARRGSLVFVSSLAGLHGLPYLSTYSSAKMALTALAQSLRIETHGSGLHVGIAYIGATKADPEKRVLNAKGELIRRPEGVLKLEPIPEVARKVVRQIESRKYKLVHTPIGKLNDLASRYFPGLVSWALRKNLPTLRKRMIEEHVYEE